MKGTVFRKRGIDEAVAVVLGSSLGGDRSSHGSIESLWEQKLCLFAEPRETVDPFRRGLSGEALTEVACEVVAITREQVVCIPQPDGGHGVDEMADLFGGEMCEADEKRLTKAGVGRLSGGGGENACGWVWMAAEGVLDAVYADAAVKEADAKVVQVAVDGGDGVRVVGVLQVVHIELDGEALALSPRRGLALGGSHGAFRGCASRTNWTRDAERGRSRGDGCLSSANVDDGPFWKESRLQFDGANTVRPTAVLLTPPRITVTATTPF